jgi:hypothetical protein
MFIFIALNETINNVAPKLDYLGFDRNRFNQIEISARRIYSFRNGMLRVRVEKPICQPSRVAKFGSSAASRVAAAQEIATINLVKPLLWCWKTLHILV